MVFNIWPQLSLWISLVKERQFISFLLHIQVRFKGPIEEWFTYILHVIGSISLTYYLKGFQFTFLRLVLWECLKMWDCLSFPWCCPTLFKTKSCISFHQCSWMYTSHWDISYGIQYSADAQISFCLDFNPFALYTTLVVTTFFSLLTVSGIFY